MSNLSGNGTIDSGSTVSFCAWTACIALRNAADDAIKNVRMLRSARSLECLVRTLDLGADHAVLDMVVDQAHGLHEGVHRGRADQLPALFLERLRQRDR